MYKFCSVGPTVALLVVALAGAILGGCSSDPEERPQEDLAVTPEMLKKHEVDVEGWHDWRLGNLRLDDGWLSLVGLSWLEEGSNTVGSAEDAMVPLPASVAPQVATLELVDGAVELKPLEGQAIEVDGQIVEAPNTVELRSDMEEPASTVRLGTVSLLLIDRDGRLGIRVKDSASKVLTEFEGIERFPVSWDWRKTADYEPRSEPVFVETPTALGVASQMKSPGRIRFEHDGKSHQLDAFETANPDEVWFVFADSSNGQTTYGGGRFVYAKFDQGGPGEAGPLVVDFNRSYNPPCVFTPYATCPLATPENRLAVAVEAGEKTYSGGYY